MRGGFSHFHLSYVAFRKAIVIPLKITPPVPPNRHYHENRRQTHTVIPAKAGIHRDEGTDPTIFIPLMWPDKAMVIPAKAGIHRDEGAASPFSSSYVAFTRP